MVYSIKNPLLNLSDSKSGILLRLLNIKGFRLEGQAVPSKMDTTEYVVFTCLSKGDAIYLFGEIVCNGETHWELGPIKKYYPNAKLAWDNQMKIRFPHVEFVKCESWLKFLENF